MSREYVHYIVPQDRAFCPSNAHVAALVEALRRDRWVPSEMHAAKWSKAPRAPKARFAVPIPPRPPPIPEGGPIFVVDPRIPPKRPPVRPREEDIPSPLEAAFLDAQRVRDPVHPSGSDYELWFPVWPPEDGADYFQTDLRYPFTRDEEDRYDFSHVIAVLVGGDFMVPWTNSFDNTEARCPCGADLVHEPEGGRVFSPIDCHYRIPLACPSCDAPVRPSSFSTQMMDPWTHERTVLAGSVASRFTLQIDCDQHFPKEVEFHLSRDLADLVATTLGQPVLDFGGFT